MSLIRSIADIEEGVAALALKEARFATIAAKGMPPLRRSPGGFATLIEIVVEQMISLKAAEAILHRLRRTFEPFDAELIHESPVEQLRELGLSLAKARSVKAIAQEIVEGMLNFNELEGLSDDEAHRRLTRLRGIGAWSADIYLLSALGRRDVWPSADVALRSAVQQVFELKKRPNVAMMDDLAEPWRPWRAVAARLLWTHYRRVRGLAQAG
jgi:DNA-3-methyladenine glycosylase II